MADANVDVVRRLFDDYAEGGVEAVLQDADENVVIEIPPELSAEPDTYRGHEGVRRYFGGFEGMIDDVRYEALELTGHGRFVIAHIRLSGRGMSSGLDVDLEAFVVHELEDGRIVRIRPYADMESAQRAVSG
ncbi:MAG TPA: nuclear transport factor 2 family protein [Thermoleophilaceae bacterium]|nr:nuclear transport factor 2 family protein [Thermoleophilaceae bacterium]